jgi:hypothetical protein
VNPFEGIKRDSVGCIQLVVRMETDVYREETKDIGMSASDTTPLKIWKKDEIINETTKIATRFGIFPNDLVLAKLGRH